MNSRIRQPTETIPSNRLPRSSVETAVVVRCLLQLFIMSFIVIGATIYITPAAVAQNPQATIVNDTVQFSARVEALPYPPDAREIELDATFHGIEFRSGSSLASLDAFYRRELRQRGWIEDESAAKRDEESSDMTFTQDSARLEIELDVYSKEIAVNIDCEELDFGRSTDPAALAAAGVPQPRSYLFLQKEIARPSEIQETEYKSNACYFKSKLSLQAAFDFYGKSMQGLGWRESRRQPIITNDRRYTEFKKGPVTVSVNIFSHDVGSRIILGYKHEKPEPVVPPLAPVDSSLAKRNNNGAPVDAKADLPAKVPVDATRNTGSATVMLGATKYEFKHVAAYRTKSDGIRSPDDTLKVEGDRIRGEMRMPKPQELFDETVQLSAKIDAAIITRNTTLSTANK